MLDIFCERFPKYALFASHWKPIDLANIDVLYLYNQIASYETFKPWLKENPQRQLVCLESGPNTIATLLQQNNPIFSDAQVDIELAPFDLAALAEKYPVKRIELLGHQKLRLALLRKTTLSHALFIDRLHGHQPFENFVRNLSHLYPKAMALQIEAERSERRSPFPEGKGEKEDRFGEVAASPNSKFQADWGTNHAFYANGLKNAFQGVPAIICGAGPSLQNAIALLKKLEKKALIIAGGSAVAALSAKGVLPHFGMAIDPNLEEYRRFRNSFALECPLLFSTRLFPGVFRTCNGPFGYMRSGIGGACELWMEEELGLTDPLLGENLSEESTSVTPICLAFAQHIGCSTVLLAGVDLAYTGGRRYAEGISSEKEQFQAIEASKSAPDRILRRKDKRGKFVNTAVRWVMEAAAIAHFAKKHPEIRWINTTGGGLRIEGFEERALEDFPFSSEWDLRKMVREQIALHPMPQPKKDLLGELKESLERLINHLEVLGGRKSGSKTLAEFELKEELAASVLFYDMDKVLRQSQREDKWGLYLEIAKKYEVILRSHTLGVCSSMSGR